MNYRKCPGCSRDVGLTRSTVQPRFRFHHDADGHLCKMSGQPPYRTLTNTQSSDA